MGIPALGGATHARYVDGHSRDCDAHHRWASVDEGTNGACRHMPFDHIAFNHGRMACTCFDWNSEALLVAGKSKVFCARYLGSVVLQVPDPVRAASSAGGLVHINGEASQDTRGGVDRGLC